MSIIALFGGEGVMPYKVIEGIHDSNQKVLLLAMRGVTPQNLVDKADFVTWGYITQVGKARKACIKYNVKEVIMAGRVKHNLIFGLSLFKMDFPTLWGLLKIRDLRADSIFRGIAEIFSKKGLKIISSIGFLKKHLAKPGVLTKKAPSKKEMGDIAFGKMIALELSRLDIGQTVIIKNKAIVAIEAMEGTDSCLERAGGIAGKGCVVVKMPRPNQDDRFDVPVIGRNTIEKLVKINFSVLAIAAGKTIIIDEDTIKFADDHGIAIVSLDGFS